MYRMFENTLSIAQRVALRAQYKEWKDQEEAQPSPLGFHDVFTQESFEQWMEEHPLEIPQAPAPAPDSSGATDTVKPAITAPAPASRNKMRQANLPRIIEHTDDEDSDLPRIIEHTDDEDAEQPRPDPSRPATESGQFPFQGSNEQSPTCQLDPLLENMKGNLPDFVPTDMMDVVMEVGSSKPQPTDADNKLMVQHDNKSMVSHQPVMNQAANKQQPTETPMVRQKTTVPTTTALVDMTKQQPAASGAAIGKQPTTSTTTTASMDWTKRMMTGDDPPRDPSRLDQKDEVILPCSEGTYHHNNKKSHSVILHLSRQGRAHTDPMPRHAALTQHGMETQRPPSERQLSDKHCYFPG